MYRSIGVLGGNGGVGASTFAAVLAAVGGAVLVDLEPASGGIDVLLGIDRVPGARWSGLRVAGGHLDPDVLLTGLPRWRGCPVLAADCDSLDPAAVGQVLDTVRLVQPMVLDLPRHDNPARAAAVQRCDLVVVVGRTDPAGMVGAHTTLAALAGAVPVGLVLRRGSVAPHSVADTVGAALLGSLATLAPTFDLGAGRLPRGAARVAGGVVSGLRHRHEAVR